MTRTMDEPGYHTLADVLARAFEQAAHGKGRERHANDKPFHLQPMQELIAAYGTGFSLGQAEKKARESQAMEHDAMVRELLGAIVYLAGTVVFLDKREQERQVQEAMEQHAANQAAVDLMRAIKEAAPILEPGTRPYPMPTLREGRGRRFLDRFMGRSTELPKGQDVFQEGVALDPDFRTCTTCTRKGACVATGLCDDVDPHAHYVALAERAR